MLPSFEKTEKKKEQALEVLYDYRRRFPRLAEIDERLTALQMDPTANVGLEMEKLISERENFLRKKKIPPDFDQPQYDCLLCQDSGYIEEVDEEATARYNYPVTRRRKCHCLLAAEQQERMLSLFTSARLTPEMKRQTFATFKTEYYSDIDIKNGFTHRKIMEHNKAIAEEFTRDIIAKGQKFRGLYLQGDPGVGKTHLCSAIANELLERNIPVLYLPFVDFLYHLRSTFNDSSLSLEDMLAVAKEAEILILDDLGAENVSEFSQEVLFSILNARMAEPTTRLVLSGNYRLEDLYEIYHPRIVSRIKALTTVLDCVGEDMRGRRV